MQIQQMRAFIIRTVYYLLWAAILLALLKWVLPAAAPFVIGFGLAALLRPVVRLFGRYCAANEKALAVFVMVLFYLTIGLAAVLLALRCALWVQQALVYLPDFYDQALRPGLEQLRQAVQRLADPHAGPLCVRRRQTAFRQPAAGGILFVRPGHGQPGRHGGRCSGLSSGERTVHTLFLFLCGGLPRRYPFFTALDAAPLAPDRFGG